MNRRVAVSRRDLHQHGSADVRVKSFYFLALILVVSQLLVHHGAFQKHTQPLVNDYPITLPKILYSKPNEAIFIPGPRKLSTPSFQLMALSEIHSVVDEYMRAMNNNFVDIYLMSFENFRLC